MKERINALGQYISKRDGKNFNYKIIKGDSIYRGLLFTVLKEDFVISDSKNEVLDTLYKMSMKYPDHIPQKLMKKYTHMKFQKAKEKKIENFNLNGKRYFIVKL